MTPRGRHILFTFAYFLSLCAAAILGIIPSLRHHAPAAATYNTAGAINPQNRFLHTLGSNDRSCVTCHAADQAWSLSVPGAHPAGTNLHHLTTVMLDGPATVKPLNTATTDSANLAFDLTDQARSAVTSHAQGAAVPSDQQLAAIVQFESGLTSAEFRDKGAGSLSSDGASGGPLELLNLTAAQQRNLMAFFNSL